MPEIDDFKFSSPIQLRWSDLDPIGHVNNVTYFDYFQDSRGLYMLAASKTWDWYKNMFVIAHIEADYISELRFDHKNPKVWVKATRFGTKSFDLEYLITSEKNGEIIVHAKGKSTQVVIDLGLKKSIEIPDWMKEEINQYES
jgi:acyl-CoA thioester hydrolase